jgi:hypothetical protein
MSNVGAFATGDAVSTYLQSATHLLAVDCLSQSEVVSVADEEVVGQEAADTRNARAC